MTLSAAERQACLDQVVGIITQEFQVKFQNQYSIVITTVGLHPEQVNNEMRNMLTHLARALVAESCETVNKEIGLARGHLTRAQRDCLKLANLHILKQIKDDLAVIRLRDGPAAFPLRRRAKMHEELQSIQDRLKAARTAEVEGHEMTVDFLEQANADLQEYRKKYLDDALLDGTPPHFLTTLWLRTKDNWTVFVLGVAASLAAAGLYALITGKL
jgi:hypothetical protein